METSRIDGFRMQSSLLIVFYCVAVTNVALAQPDPEQGAPGAPSTADAEPKAAIWYYKQKKRRQGPVTAAQMRALYKEKKVFADTKIWREGMGQYHYLVHVRAFADLVDWFYSRQGRNIGPIKTSKLHQLVKNGWLPIHSQVWRRGLRGWRAIRSLEELSGLVKATGQSPSDDPPGMRPPPPLTWPDKPVEGLPEEPPEEPPEHTVPPPQAAPPGEMGDASSGRANMSRSDIAGGVYIESHFYALNSAVAATGGRVLLGARISIKSRFVLGLEAVTSWFSPDNSGVDGAVMFSNLALLFDAKVFGSERLHGLVSLKVHIPVLGEFETTGEFMTFVLGSGANSYEMGFYLPYTMTWRPEFKIYHRTVNNIVFSAETGFDFFIAISADKIAESSSLALFRKENFALNWHVGGKFGYLISEMFFPYLEVTMSRMAYVSDGDAGDSPTLFTVSPGLQFQYKKFEGGLNVQIPTHPDLREMLSAVICVKLGGRF